MSVNWPEGGGRDTDADIPILKQAKAEYAKLLPDKH
jgi:hypothetical protein